MIKVTMNLTDQDVANAERLHGWLGARSKAHAISVALSLTRFAVEALRQPGTQLLLRHADGSLERIVMPELQNATSATPGGLKPEKRPNPTPVGANS